MVDEDDAGKIRLGQKALVQVDAVKGRVVEAEISSISGILRQASYDRPQKIAEVFLKLTDSNLAQMRPGMSAKSLIEVDRYLGVLVVPVALIVEKEGRSFVQVVGLNGEKDELREIQIRISDGTTAVVSSGVKEGEKIRSKPTLTT
jgi:hypothetical protein